MTAPPRRKKVVGWRKQDAVRLAVLAWILGCWWIGAQRSGGSLEPFLNEAWPEATQFEDVGDDTFRAEGDGGEVLGYVTTGTASGYGGPLSVAVSVTPDGLVESLAVVEHRETPSFFRRVIDARFLRRLAGKTAADPIVLDEDVDGVSGATYTSLALTQSVHRAARTIAQDRLQLAVPADERRIVFGLPEIVLIALFAVAVLRRRIGGKIGKALRWVTLLGGLLFLGFAFNSSFVLAHVNMVLLGYWPEWQTHFYWYLLIAGLLLFKATEEWNVYCYDFCPFGAMQEIAAKIGGARPKRLRWHEGLVWAQRFLTLAAISLALLYRNPGLSSYEIFGTAFRLEGSNFQFALLAIILLSSLFLHRPWCRHLCPLHRNTAEGLFDNTRRIVRTTWQTLKARLRPA
jgi:NosR/NirI family nitrous oxide reductase transcriptional regulator